MKQKADRVASLIRLRREELGITQLELAQKLGWMNSHSMGVSNIENCKVQLPVKKVPLICEVLNIEMKELVDAMAEDYKASIYELFDERKMFEVKRINEERKQLFARLKELRLK